jgi:sialic acid synthase SpsE
MPRLTICNRVIDVNHVPLIVAEMSGNHNQSLDTALELVEVAAASGTEMLKLQTYTADTMPLDCRMTDFYIQDKVYGKGNTCMNYTKWLIHHGIGASL